METIKKGEILEVLNKGTRIRNQEWDCGKYIYFNGEKLLDQYRNEYDISISTLLSEQWYGFEVVKDTNAIIKALFSGKEIHSITSGMKYKIDDNVICECYGCTTKRIEKDDIDICLNKIQWEEFIILE